MKQELGDLDRVKGIVKVLGMVNATPSFGDQPKVINGCSDLFGRVFGEAGTGACSAVGMGSLPNHILSRSKSSASRVSAAMNRAWLAAALWALPLGLPARAAEPYEIPVIAALTGGGSVLGDAEKQALELAEKLFNRAGGIHGRPVHFTYHDDQSSPQLAVQALNEILAAQPTVILGSSLVASCNAMAPLVKNGPVMYCFSPGVHPPAGSYVYTSLVLTFDYAQALVNFFRASGRTRLALMTSTDATGQDAEKGFDELDVLVLGPRQELVETLVGILAGGVGRGHRHETRPALLAEEAQHRLGLVLGRHARGEHSCRPADGCRPRSNR